MLRDIDFQAFINITEIFKAQRVCFIFGMPRDINLLMFFIHHQIDAGLLRSGSDPKIRDLCHIILSGKGMTAVRRVKRRMHAFSQSGLFRQLMLENTELLGRKHKFLNSIMMVQTCLSSPAQVKC